jgi:outer membrane lipoprotein-sorting protein
MRTGIQKLALAGVCLALTLSPGAARPAQDATRAKELLAEARAALGGEAQLAAVQSLSISGSVTRTSGMGAMEGFLSIDLQLPDKFRKSETLGPTPEFRFTSIQVVNGNEAFTDAESGGGAMIFNAGGMGAQVPPEVKASFERGIRAGYARTMIYLFCESPANFRVEFTYAGVEDTSGKPADVLEIKGPDNFTARLHLDQKTHLPVMMTYKVRSRSGMQFRTLGGGGESREELQKKAQDAMAKADSPENMVEVQLRFSDYKAVGGILFPRKVTEMSGDVVTEEREYSKVKINPTLKPDRFKKKEQQN